MHENNQKSLISKSLNYSTKSRRLHWLAPVFVIVLYIVVMMAFFSLQRIHTNLLPYFVNNNEGLQHLLNLIIIALSTIIIFSLFLIWFI